MKSSFLKYLALALILAMLIIPCACAKPKPAAFEVTSLNVTPPEVTTGETVNITAVVENTGGSEGTYTAVLTVDGATVETKEVVLAAAESKTVSFSLVKDTHGTYQVGIDGLTSSLTVKQKMVVKEVELKYDDGEARESIWSGGYIVDFSPPATPFTIKRIRIAGGVYAKGLEERTFDFEIWGQDMKVLYTTTYPYTKFPVGATAWVEFEVPDIEVAGKFYVHIYTGSPYPGLQIGADDSVVNEHSDVTIRTAEGATYLLASWPYSYWSPTPWFADKSKVNWMIRVAGTYMAPED
jgi:hypothetical protein